MQMHRHNFKLGQFVRSRAASPSWGFATYEIINLQTLQSTGAMCYVLANGYDRPLVVPCEYIDANYEPVEKEDK